MESQLTWIDLKSTSTLLQSKRTFQANFLFNLRSLLNRFNRIRKENSHFRSILLKKFSLCWSNQQKTEKKMFESIKATVFTANLKKKRQKNQFKRPVLLKRKLIEAFPAKIVKELKCMSQILNLSLRYLLNLIDTSKSQIWVNSSLTNSNPIQ